MLTRTVNCMGRGWIEINLLIRRNLLRAARKKSISSSPGQWWPSMFGAIGEGRTSRLWPCWTSPPVPIIICSQPSTPWFIGPNLRGRPLFSRANNRAMIDPPTNMAELWKFFILEGNPNGFSTQNKGPSSLQWSCNIQMNPNTKTATPSIYITSTSSTVPSVLLTHAHQWHLMHLHQKRI
jgi:hypothetical protein